MSAFQTLLVEVVKDPEARWADWWPKLQTDAQVGGCSLPAGALLVRSGPAVPYVLKRLPLKAHKSH